MVQTTSSSHRPYLKWFWLALFILIVAGVTFWLQQTRQEPVKTGHQFTKEGILRFVDPDSSVVLKEIEIEVAADELEIQYGLMWRRSMRADRGMLFIMERNEKQSFWMLNTYIPLDIIFVNDQFKIVDIKPDRKPQSLGDIVSAAPAKYVIEVNAGFCDTHHIEIGDVVNFELD